MAKVTKIYEANEYDMLKPIQKAWIDHYIETRNYGKASALAGYKGNNSTLRRVGYDNYRKFEKIIQPRIEFIEAKAENKRINELVDIFKMWSDVMNDEDARMTDRLKASEMLAKAKGGFIEKVEVKQVDTDWFKE